MVHQGQIYLSLQQLLCTFVPTRYKSQSSTHIDTSPRCDCGCDYCCDFGRDCGHDCGCDRGCESGCECGCDCECMFVIYYSIHASTCIFSMTQRSMLAGDVSSVRNTKGGLVTGQGLNGYGLRVRCSQITICHINSTARCARYHLYNIMIK